MGYRGNGPGSPWLLFLLIVVGSLLGTALGAILGEYLSFLNISQSIGFPTTTLDLSFARITLGLQLRISIATLIGALLAYMAYRKL